MTPALWRYLIAAGLVRLADEGARVVLLVLAIDRLGSPALGGLLVACFLIPHVIAAPAVGALADHARHRARFQALALAGFGGSLISIGLLTGAVPFVLILVIALLGGCLGPLVTGGMTSLIRQLVSEAGRTRAFGLDVMTYNVAGIVGPAGAVMLATAVNSVLATIALGAIALLGAVLVVTLPIESAARRAQPLSWRDVVSTDALRFLFTNIPLRAATIGSSLGAVGYAALALVALLLAAEAGRPSLSGLYLGATAVGGLLGSTIYAWRPTGVTQPVRTVAYTLLAIAVASIVTFAMPSTVGRLVGFALIGVPTGALASSVFLVRDQESPPSLQTQIFTLGGGLKTSSAAIGSFLAGLAAGAGGGAILLGVAALHVVAAGTSLLIARTGRAHNATGGDSAHRLTPP